MNIYFAGAIRGGRDDADIYMKLIQHLQQYGTVLTEHLGSPSLTSKGEHTLYAKFIHDRDMEWLEVSDLIVAEVTQPSLGVGYELGRAAEQGREVLCLFREGAGKHLSAMVDGSSAFVVRRYTTLDEGKRMIDEYFKNEHEK